MTISNATINVDVWDTIRTALVSANIKVTNSTTTQTRTCSISTSYNDKKTTSPQIIIYPIAKDESEYKFGASRGRMFINVTIECYYDTSLGVAQMADQVEQAIADYDFGSIELVAVSSDTAYVNPNENKYHLKVITFTFDRE